MDKLKTPTNTLRVLKMEGTFYNSIERHLIPVNLPNLTSIDFSRGGGAYFHPDDRGNNTSDSNYIADNRGDESYCPDIPASVTSYKIRSNDFRSVDLNVSTGKPW